MRDSEKRSTREKALSIFNNEASGNSDDADKDTESSATRGPVMVDLWRKFER